MDANYLIGLNCPIRWIRSCAWLSTAGFHQGSIKKTYTAGNKYISRQHQLDLSAYFQRRATQWVIAAVYVDINKGGCTGLHEMLR